MKIPLRVCKEAGADSRHLLRPAPHPGPRCATCHRRVTKERKQRVAFQRIERVYGITEADYRALYELQGRACICGKATGKTKRLAVDHDHYCMAGHPPDVGCRLCVRGLLCGKHNRLVGELGDDPEIFERFADYLRNPPARRLFNQGD